mgnify:CR=1 FL=1
MIQNYNKKQSPFKVPENYFENFNKEIMTRLPEKQKAEPQIIPFRKRILSWSAAAAILIVIIVSGSMLWKGSSNGGNSVLNNSTYSANVEEYYESMEATSIESTYKDLFYTEYGYY